VKFLATAKKSTIGVPIDFPPSLKCADDKPSSGGKVKRVSDSRPDCTFTRTFQLEGA